MLVCFGACSEHIGYVRRWCSALSLCRPAVLFWSIMSSIFARSHTCLAGRWRGITYSAVALIRSLTDAQAALTSSGSLPSAWNQLEMETEYRAAKFSSLDSNSTSSLPAFGVSTRRLTWKLLKLLRELLFHYINERVLATNVPAIVQSHFCQSWQSVC